MTFLKLNRFDIATTASIFALLVTTHQATAQGADHEQMISRADANNDGDVSWEEVMSLRTESFERLDRNSDGVVNADDSPARPFSARFNEALTRLRADFDSDRDGEITKDEMLGAPAPMFEHGDVNDDSVLSSDEIAALKRES